MRGISSLLVVQAAIAAALSYRTVQAKVAVEEGVRYTAEPIIAPIVFGLPMHSYSITERNFIRVGATRIKSQNLTKV